MDATDRKLLNLLQAGLPLAARPFAEIATKLALDESEVIARVQALCRGRSLDRPIERDGQDGCRGRSSDRPASNDPMESGAIRKIGPILDSRKLGYVSTLAALSVPENKIDPVAAIVNSFPGVTHNYLRERGLTLFTERRRGGQTPRPKGSDPITERRTPCGPARRWGLTPNSPQAELREGSDPETRPRHDVERDLTPTPETRAAPFNMWFTVHARDEKELQNVISEIERRTALKVTRFDATKMFKISVRFDLEESEAKGVRRQRGVPDPIGDDGRGLTPVPSQPRAKIDDKDIALLKAAQDGLPLCAEPYAALGAQIAMPAEEVIARLTRLLKTGVIRRIAASLAHRAAGFTANAMVAWQVPEEKIEEIGNAFAQRNEITHCYSRTTAPNFPYNLYTMLHAKSKDACNKIVSALSAATGLTHFLVLYSTRELKKTSFRI